LKKGRKLGAKSFPIGEGKGITDPEAQQRKALEKNDLLQNAQREKEESKKIRNQIGEDSQERKPHPFRAPSCEKFDLERGKTLRAF